MQWSHLFDKQGWKAILANDQSLNYQSFWTTRSALKRQIKAANLCIKLLQWLDRVLKCLGTRPIVVSCYPSTIMNFFFGTYTFESPNLSVTIFLSLRDWATFSSKIFGFNWNIQFWVVGTNKLKAFLGKRCTENIFLIALNYEQIIK